MSATRTYLGFLTGVIAITYGGTQLWSLAFGLRHGAVSLGLAASGVVAVPVLAVGLLIVGRVLYVFGRRANHVGGDE